jgi:hypothetical protein
MTNIAMANAPGRTDTTGVPRPEWFAAFLADRGTRKPSAHTLKAYRQDFGHSHADLPRHSANRCRIDVPLVVIFLFDGPDLLCERVIGTASPA